MVEFERLFPKEVNYWVDRSNRKPMHIERFFVPGLAHACYLVASGNEAVVVDPERNVGDYLAYLARNKLKLTGIFLTHLTRISWPATLSFPIDLVLRSLFRESSCN